VASLMLQTFHENRDESHFSSHRHASTRTQFDSVNKAHVTPVIETPAHEMACASRAHDRKLSGYFYLLLLQSKETLLMQPFKIAPLVLILTLKSAPALADVLIDDFSSGSFSQTVGITGFSPWVGFQSGPFVGGTRLVSVETFDGTHAENPSTVAVTPAGTFEMQSGAGVSHRVILAYGRDNNYGITPLGLDLSGTDRIRIHFTHNNSPFNQLNFNIQLYNGITPYVQIGYNVPGSAAPFDWDFKYADGAYPGGPIDFSHIDLMVFQAQGAQDWGIDAITAISAVPEPESSAMLLAGLGLIGFAARRRRNATRHLPLRELDLRFRYGIGRGHANE
jgi:hypothetical protein